MSLRKWIIKSNILCSDSFNYYFLRFVHENICFVKTQYIATLFEREVGFSNLPQ